MKKKLIILIVFVLSSIVFINNVLAENLDSKGKENTSSTNSVYGNANDYFLTEVYDNGILLLEPFYLLKDETADETLSVDNNSSDTGSALTNVKKVSCGNISGIPEKIPDIVSTIVTVIEVIVPVILVIMGSIDLAKGIISQKDDEIKKGQRMLVKRIIVGVLIFLIIVFVKLIISLVANATDTSNMADCIDCFINNDCNS